MCFRLVSDQIAVLLILITWVQRHRHIQTSHSQSCKSRKSLIFKISLIGLLVDAKAGLQGSAVFLLHQPNEPQSNQTVQLV
jgi:hypothetical protein